MSDEHYCRRGYWPIPKPTTEIELLRQDIQAAKDRDSYRENLISELKAERTNYRDRAETLSRRVTWFLSLTEGMLATEQVKAILEEISE